MIHFVGAGPGDMELITVKGMKKLQEADVVIYAGSLVNEGLLTYCKSDVMAYDSASMDLPSVLEVMEKAWKEQKKVVRLHTGDPSLYGAIKEQMKTLDEKEIPYEVIPGVSSFLGAAAQLKTELTLPSVSQTVILTRLEGKTGTGEGGKLEELAKHRATMAIFLSVQSIEEVVERLKTGYDADTPVAVVYKATWPDEKIVRGTLADIAEKVKEENIHRFAQIIVGHCMGEEFTYSKLYDPEFSHMYRQNTPPAGEKE